MFSLLGRRRIRSFVPPNPNSRRRKTFDWILWLIPLSLVAISGVLIASTQRQADYADWYHHWITAGIGIVIAYGVSRTPVYKFRPFLIPIYSLTVLSLLAVRLIGTSALGAQR